MDIIRHRYNNTILMDNVVRFGYIRLNCFCLSRSKINGKVKHDFCL